jgi:hypothetical protein
MRELKHRLGPERQERYFKARAIKFNRKLDAMGEAAIEPENFSRLMIEGKALLLFMTLDAMSRNSKVRI